MKSKKLLLVFILFLVIGIIVQFVSYDFVLNYLKKDFSSDGIIEKETYLYYAAKFQFIKLLLIVLPLSCLLFILFQNKIAGIFSYINTNIPRLVNTVYSKLNISQLFWFSIASVLILSVYGVFNFDIGIDESWYLNDIQNINKYGAVYHDFGDNKSFYSDVPNLPLNTISSLTVPLFGFSVTQIRIIVLIFAFLTIPAFFKLFDELTSKMAVLLLFLFPGMLSLVSAVLTEFTGFLFLVLSLILIKEFEAKNKNYLLILSAFLMSLSMATKFQFALIIVLTLIILLIIEYENKASIIFKYLLYTILFFLIILGFSFVHYGIHNGILLFKFYLLGGNQSDFSIDIRLIIYKVLMLNNLILIPLLLFIWIKSWRIIKKNYNYLYMKIIFIGAVIIMIFWNIFFSVLTWRNAFIAIAFNIILFAVYLKDNRKSVKLILIPYIMVGITANFLFVQNGIHDDVQYYNAHLLDHLLSLKKNDNQKMFFNKAAEIIKPEDDVYVPGQFFIPRLLLNNRTIKSITSYKRSDETQYIIIAPADFKERWIFKEDVQTFISKSKKVLQVGEYILYQRQ